MSDESGGAGAGGASEKTYTQDEFDAAMDELRGKVDEFRQTNIDMMKKLKAFDGIDPSEHRALTQKVAELEQHSKATEAGMTGEQLAKLRSDVEADVIKRFAGDSKAGLETFGWARDLASENRSLKLDSVVKAQMAKGGARSERIDALFKLTADRFGLTDDGQPVLREKPATDIEKYVADELRKEYPEFYNGSGSSGGGASKSTAGGGGFTKTIAANDRAAFMANLEDIASGKVTVETP